MLRPKKYSAATPEKRCTMPDAYDRAVFNSIRILKSKNEYYRIPP